MDEFRDYFHSNAYNLIAVTESWLNNAISDAQVAMLSYTVLRVDRRGRIGGGVALYVRDGLVARVLSSSEPLPSTDVPEFLITEVWSPSQPKLLIAIVYRPPSVGDIETFEMELA